VLKSNNIRLLFFIWFILAIALLLTCSIPKEIDFERYMAISQYIYTHHEYLLLHFNGNIYTDKPPLMFWLIALGWHVLGSINIWWPYLMLTCFSGASVFMTYQIAKILHEEDFVGNAQKAFQSALFLLLLVFFGMTTCELRVDTLLLFFVLLIHYGCLKPNRLGCWSIFFGIFFGLYSKGPLIFVVGLLPALCGLYAAKREIRWKSILIAVFFGIIPILFWLVPACIQGGAAYQHDVLFGQIANRSTRNDSSVFFYLMRLPGYLFPFMVFPSVWKGLYRSIRYYKSSSSISRYCLSGIFLLVLIFSLFGQKAMHYLLPTMPFWAIFLTEVIKFDKADRVFLKIFLWILLVIIGLIWYSQTGTGLQFLSYINHYMPNYSLYLVTQSFQLWQLIGFMFFLAFALVVLYKFPKLIVTIIILLSIVIQVNIQVLNQTYFHSRFLTYFREDISAFQGRTFEILLSEKNNEAYCSPLLPPDIVALATPTDKVPDYLISNQRCLFFNARFFDAVPVTTSIPQIHCAFGLWKMNKNTQKLMEFCAEK
jgi:4-amino-4-deoxy-L-arabinose transferase-like glycosyltransferase